MMNTGKSSTCITTRRGWSVSEAADIYGVSRGFLLNRIRQGDLVARKIGRRVIVLDSDLVRFFGSEKDK